MSNGASSEEEKQGVIEEEKSQKSEKSLLGKRFACRLCDYKTSFKHNLTKHVRNVHDEAGSSMKLKHEVIIEDGKRVYPCSVCEKKFTHPTSLKNHMRSTHKENELRERGVNINALNAKIAKK